MSGDCLSTRPVSVSFLILSLSSGGRLSYRHISVILLLTRMNSSVNSSVFFLWIWCCISIRVPTAFYSRPMLVSLLLSDDRLSCRRISVILLVSFCVSDGRLSHRHVSTILLFHFKRPSIWHDCHGSSCHSIARMIIYALLASSISTRYTLVLDKLTDPIPGIWCIHRIFIVSDQLTMSIQNTHTEYALLQALILLCWKYLNVLTRVLSHNI